jgi:hypothetical protein
MKKILIFAAAALVSLSAAAGKKVVIAVGDFKSTAAVSYTSEEKVKQNVTSGLSAVQHLEMIDSQDGLGADYLVTGNVLSFNVTRIRKENGEVWWKTTLSYSVDVTNLKDGTTFSKTYKYDGSDGLMSVKYGYSMDENASNEAVFNFIPADMKIFAYENFPLSGQIVESDYKLDKKGKLTECYITLGSEDGVSEKTKFEVLLGKQVAGRTTTAKADVTIQVLEVVAGDLARCKVVGKEADKVGAALEAYASDPANALPVQVKMLPPRDMQGWF